MSNLLSVTQVRELVESLKGVMRDFAVAEEKLEKDFRAKIDATERKFREEQEAHQASAASSSAELEALHQKRKARIEFIYDRRKARIARAHKSSHKLSAQRIDDEEGNWKYKSQKGLLDTKRFRSEALARNDAKLAEFQQRLEESRAALTSLKDSASRSFRGDGQFKKLLEMPPGPREPNPQWDEDQLLEEFTKATASIREGLNSFQRFLTPKIFALFPLWLWVGLVVALAAGLPVLLAQLGRPAVSFPQAAIGAGIILGCLLALFFSGRSKAAPFARSIASELETARRMLDAAAQKSQERHAIESDRVENETRNSNEMFQQNWQSAVEQANQARALWPAKIEDKALRITTKNETRHAASLRRVETEREAALSAAHDEARSRQAQFTEAHAAKIARFTAEHQAHWQKLEADWKQLTTPLFALIDAVNREAQQEFLPWDQALWENWQSPSTFKNLAPFAQLEVDLRKVAEAAPRDARLGLPPLLSIALVLKYPHEGSVLFETTKASNEPVIAALNNIMFRLIASSPAGKLSFTIIDPIKLGQNFAGVMHLADYEDNLINSRILTQASQIEQRLADLNEHMEKVIQMYLRNEYETIAEYNRQAGNIAEKYHFVVVADFPANFTETAARRLLHIAASGARCGVFTLIHWDHRHTGLPDFFPEELRKSSVCIVASGDQFALSNPFLGGARVVLDRPPTAEFAIGFLHKVGAASRGANRVEVPFRQVAPLEDEIWTQQTAEELRVPIGRSGATKLQYLAIGKGTRQHALIAGKTGSGKSTLFHVIITNLALWCSPEQVEFYLVDFKKGVEFKSYAAKRLPHARVVAIESDREFGLSVLQRLDEELKRRGELFRSLGVQDVAGYQRAGGKEPMPRALLLIDEFQEFFVEDDRISQAANLLLDRIVRQGRAFGIHCILGSQTLGGAYTLARTTMGQMVIRVALQCNEADAYLIMDENNPAPRLLSRPGEGIYNDMAGMSEGNSPFQAVWIGDEERDVWLDKIRARAEANGDGTFAGPIVFEGNAPADIRENPALRQLLEATTVVRPPPRCGSGWALRIPSKDLPKPPSKSAVAAIFSLWVSGTKRCWQCSALG